MVSKKSRLMALLLAVMTLLSVVAVGAFSTSAASGSTVYCENAAGWSTVYCYMWGDSGKNGEWPGVQMTQGSDGLWAYTPTDNWNNIIFNGGNNGPQTDDLTLGGNCFNNSTNSWSTVGNPDTPDTPDTPDVPDVPVTPTGKITVYCKNSANWGKVNVYMWNSEQDKNAAWPGAPATHLGDGVWMYEASKNYTSVIFNDGNTQTDDLAFKGPDYIYDNSTGSWELYDTSKLHIKNFTADVASPQYTGVKINLSAVAGGGEGDLSYKFSVGSTVISDFSGNSTVSWTPATAGSYTVKVDVKDTLGETISKSMTFEIKDINAETKPVIQSVEATPSSFTGTEIKKGTETTIDVTAGGGNTGTKLLFYKVDITDAAGKTVNVPYFSLKNEAKFTPAATGTYSVTATVEASDNSFTTRTVEYESVNEFSKPGELSLSVSAKEAGDKKYTVTATAAGGTAPYKYEFKLNGAVAQASSDKATYTFDAAADGNYTIEVTVKDAAGKTVTKSTSVQVGGSVDPLPTDPKPTDPKPTDPKPSEPVVQELTAALSVEEKGDGIYKFTANAQGGEGAYQYQFSENGAVVKDFSTSNTVTLNMSVDGTYTIKVAVKDAKGAVANDEKVITIKNGVVDMAFTIDMTLSKDGEYVKATVTAIGGQGGYKYQYLINGTVYKDFSDKGEFTFGVPANFNADYTVVVKVKDASGEVLEDTGFVWVQDNEIFVSDVAGRPEQPTTQPTKPTDPKPTVKPTDPAGEYLKGDADCNGKVNVQDATIIQKYIAKVSTMSEQGKVNGEVDGNGKLNVKDATMIQKFIANIVKW